MIGKVLRNKYFWVALTILIPFAVVWYKEGFFWAIIVLIILGVIFFSIFAARRRRVRRYYYDDDDEEIAVRRPRRHDYDAGGDTDVNIRQKRQCPECGGSGRVEWGSEASGMPLITKGAPGSSKYVRCPVCGGKGWIWD